MFLQALRNGCLPEKVVIPYIKRRLRFCSPPPSFFSRMALKCPLDWRAPRLAAPLTAASAPGVATEVIYSVSEVEEKEEKLLDWNGARENMAEQGDTSPALESK